MRLAGLIAAAALAAALPAGLAAQEAAIALAPGEVLLKVDAQGEHLGRPDMMTISAGVVTTAPTAREALAANNALAGRLLEAVRRSGVETRDVRTSELTVNPQFARDRDNGGDDEENVRRIVGYVARNRVELRLRDLAKAPAIVSTLFEAGANEVRGPSFGYADPAPALRAARRAAVAEARAEADTYADALGMRVARVLKVSERQSDEEERSGYIVVTGSRVMPTPIEPGEVATRVQVWIDYAMVPR